MDEQALIDGISAILVLQGNLTKEDAQNMHTAFRASDADRFEEFLVDEEVVEKEALLKALQQFYKLPSIDVVGILFDHDLVRKFFPKETMLQHGFIPYQHDGDLLTVIASRPLDPEVLAAIDESVTYDTVFMVGIHRDICDAVKEFYDESVATVHEDEDNEMEDEHDALEEVTEEESL